MPFDAPIHTNEANLPRVLGAGLPVLLVFWRPGCAPCDQLAPVLDRLARSYAGRVLIVKVNADEEAGLVRRYGIAHLPSAVSIRDAQPMATSVGAAAEPEWAAWLSHLVGDGSRPPEPRGPSMPLQGAGGSPSRGRGSSTAPGTPQGGGAGPAARASGEDQPVVLTDATFEGAIRSSKVPVLVDFWAPWCGPCKMIAPAVAKLAREFIGRAFVGKLNVDENPVTAGRYGVMSIPTLLIFRNGQVVDQIVGAQPEQALRQRLARQVG
jgi:thioredoxin 1